MRQQHKVLFDYTLRVMADTLPQFLALKIKIRYTYSVEMSSSWNFKARESPSYEVSEPSWGTSIFKLKPS